MNKSRRATLTMIANALEELKSRLETVRDEEQDAFDNMPESLQESERGEAMQEMIDNIDYANDSLDDVISYISEVI